MAARFLFLAALLGCLVYGVVDGVPTLRIVPATKSTQQSKVAANFPFDPPLQVEILEGVIRIASGPDSSLTVTPVLSDASLCLSVDATFNLTNGVGTFPGSICEVVGTDITISFKVTSSAGEKVSDSSNNFQVTGDIHIAYFSQDKKKADGKFEQFFRNAVDDVNAGEFRHPFRQVFTDRTLKVKSYYHGLTPKSNIKAFLEMKKHHAVNPKDKAHAIVGFSSNEVSQVLLPLTTENKYAVLSYRKDSLTAFSDKTLYPYFNRIHYSDGIIDYGLLIFMKERNWNKIIIIKGASYKFSLSFYDKAKALGISIVREFAVPDVASADEYSGRFDFMFENIKALGIQVILSTVKGVTSSYLHAEALRWNATSTDGFQWIGYKNQADFPAGNTPMGCHWDVSFLLPGGLNTLCNFRFKGMVFNEPLVLVDGWDTPEWNTIWMKHNNQDIEKTVGALVEVPLTDISGAGATYGLTYDSVIVLVEGLELLINANKTINGESLSYQIRTETSVYGTTGQLDLNPLTGDRLNYIAKSTVLWPNHDYFVEKFAFELDSYLIEWWNWETADPWVTNTIYTVANTTSVEVVESKTPGTEESLIRLYKYNDEECVTGYSAIDQKYKNKRTFKAYQGIFHYTRQVQVAYNLNPYIEDVAIPKTIETQVEYVPASFYCSNGCGGNRTDDADVTKFQNGECISQDTCLCITDATGKNLWDGLSCNQAVCTAGCKFGDCPSPGNCICYEGYEGVDCGTPRCDSCDTSGGVCVSPNNCKCNVGQFGPSCSSKCTCSKGICNEGLTGDGKCSKCDSGYIGANCDISLVALCVPSIIGGLLLIAGAYFAAQFFIKRAHLRAALLNNDWIVNWGDFKKHDEATGKSSMFLSALSMNRNAQNKKQLNTGSWEGMEVYYQILEKDTVSLTDSLRLEVKHMRDMRHVNVSAFVGACVDSPNVSILTELQPKGSLDDILSNEDIKLPWNFRFALLKGMCKGLEYIHNSEIRSHGRLKSCNCLVDNRWTIKIAGFGLHELKSNQKNVGHFDPHNPDRNPDPSKSDYGSLLWTGPEILQRGVYHIDHVGRGTVESDIYSVGLVMSEMCTRDVPFADVMLEKKEIIDMMCGRKDDAVLKVWNDYIAKLNIEQGGLIRPCIKDKEWPSKYEKRKALKKLMENCWHDDPVHRPTLREIQNNLEAIEPQRGELMDMLVTMLEKYSSNLEDIVAKRTKQLSKEKQKTEDLVSRLLPKSVADELKQGRRVAPEHFDFVTIYFSDIVGFTAIAKASTPLEVIALLNDMYTSFDSIAANYDVYKVETIGDAYMIVSGLPTRNGDNHAGEICSTAMDLMCEIGQMKIAHLPDTKMQLRSGIHTGHVVAGVVGLKMPRYCLFGESVNVASKMESGGKPMRIQVSEDTVEILRRLGGYKCDYREEVDIKGRGLIKTFWLTGKHGYDKVLPDYPDE